MMFIDCDFCLRNLIYSINAGKRCVNFSNNRNVGYACYILRTPVTKDLSDQV